MKNITVVSVILLLLSSCTAMRINYYGRSSSPTDKVDMYLYARDISAPYQVMGRAELIGNDYMLRAPVSEKVKNLVLAEGRKIGADAVVLYEESNRFSIPALTTTTSQKSSVNAFGDSTVTSTTVTSAQNNSAVLSPVFIQFK